MRIVVHLMNAFANNPPGGNPTAIVLDAECLTREQMQRIAGKLGFPETVFIDRSLVAGHRLHYFTPVTEIDLCGHATIAAYSFLARNAQIRSGAHSMETRAGILEVTVGSTGLISMKQVPPVFLGEVDIDDIADALDIPRQWLSDSGLLPEIVSTGVRDVMIAIDTAAHLSQISPIPEKVAEVSRRWGVVGLHLFSLAEIRGSAFVRCRNFAPAYGVNEESATGSSNGALACYLHKHGRWNFPEGRRVLFEQGEELGAPSKIWVSLDFSLGQVAGVSVSGNAYANGSLFLDI